MRKFIDIVEASSKDELDESTRKKLGVAAAAAATLAGASAGAHALGKHHGDLKRSAEAEQAARDAKWDDPNYDPHIWGEGDWFADAPSPETPTDHPEPEQEQDRPRGLFSFLRSENKPPVQEAKIPETELAYMAATMWGEARSEGETGMRAVAHIIKNRMAQGREKWGTTARSVTTARKQFSCWNPDDPNLPQLKRMMDIDHEVRAGRMDAADLRETGELNDYRVYRTAKSIARSVLSGQSRDFTGGADHYHTTAVSPYWKDTMTPIKKVGNHVFYDSKRKQMREGIEAQISCNCSACTPLLEDSTDGILPRQYRIRSRYDYFNRTVFEGKLPTNIPLSFTKLTKATGVTTFRFNNAGGSRTYNEGTVAIKMSNQYKRSMEGFDSVLLHEMIHVEDVVLKGRMTPEEAHDAEFQRRAKEVSAKTGINISVTDNETSGLEPATAASKPYIILVYDQGKTGDQCGVMYFRPTKSEDAMIKILKYCQRFLTDSTVQLSIYYTTEKLFSANFQQYSAVGKPLPIGLKKGPVLDKALENSRLIVDFVDMFKQIKKK